MRLEVSFLPGAERIAAVHAVEGAQLDNLCGAYWTSILLRARGVPTGQEDAAAAAGTVLPADGDPASWVPPGEPNRDVYARALPRTEDADQSGTSAPGLVAAVRELSGGGWRFVPVRGREGGAWSLDAVEALVELVGRHPAWEAALVLNLRSGALWGTRLALHDALAHLSGDAVEAPRAEWDVGHFVNLAGVVRGSARSMLLVRDSYPSFGWSGHHLQPIEAVAAGLRRDDGREGGCLLFVAERDATDVERELKETGFDIGVWDNGTPYGGGAR